jgi:hypothetical protein
VEAAVGGWPPGPRADCEFFVGWSLANRGQTDRAVELWKRSAGTDAGTRWLRAHARAFLEAGKP